MKTKISITMKKIFLLTMVLFQMTFVFGQNVLAEDEKVIQYDTDWGNWVLAPDNSNISFSAKLKRYDKQTKLYVWEVRHKVARTPIAFEWKISNQVFTGASDYSSAVGENGGFYNSATFDSNDNAKSMNGYGFTIYSSSKTTLFYQVRNVCYVFDGRNPNCNSQANTSNSKTSLTTTQQNDLTDYNNSKADLERELAEHNSGIQKQNEENAIKGQIWDNAIKAGVDAHNSGNYTEAKNQFTIAINNSTNGQDRQNAQNYYDNSVKAEKSQEKIKAVTDLAQGVIQILGDAHENKMQKLNAEIDEMDRKQEIINNDQAINTLSDTKIFETYANYVAKNFEALNIKFEKLTIYKNEKNEKEAHLNFTGLQVIITNRWLNNKMQKYINVQSDTESLYKSIYNTPFFESLKKLDPYYNEELRQEIRTNTKGNNFLIYGLENTQPFIDVYDHGYKSSTYKGFNIILQNLENEAKGKLNKTDNAVETLLEKAKLFENGTSGVEKNYQKSLQFYQLAFDNSNDKNILIAIGKLYEKGDEFLPRNVNTAIAYYEKHITNNDNINPDAFLQLGSVYSENKSDVYNLEKAKNYFESQIALLEQKYNVTQNEEEKQEIKSKIARTYYLLGSHYNYSAKKYAISIAYYEKALQWNENDSETAYYIGYIYKGGLMGKNFDSTFKKDKKKIMYWREKVCEIYSRIATQNDNSKTNVAKVYCDLAKQNLK